jgi:hypothetical protein
MGLNPCLASLALGLCLAAASARAEDCPAKSTMMDDIIAALNEAPGCERAISGSAPWSRPNASATSFPASRRCKGSTIWAKCGPASANTLIRKARCTARSQPSAAQVSPSVTRKRRGGPQRLRRLAERRAPLSGRQRRLGLFGDGLEGRRLVDCKIGKHFSIHHDA